MRLGIMIPVNRQNWNRWRYICGVYRVYGPNHASNSRSPSPNSWYPSGAQGSASFSETSVFGGFVCVSRNAVGMDSGLCSSVSAAFCNCRCPLSWLHLPHSVNTRSNDSAAGILFDLCCWHLGFYCCRSHDNPSRGINPEVYQMKADLAVRLLSLVAVANSV